MACRTMSSTYREVSTNCDYIISANNVPFDDLLIRCIHPHDAIVCMRQPVWSNEFQL